MIRYAITEIKRSADESRRSAEQRAVAECLVRLGIECGIGHRENGAPFLTGCRETSISVSHSRKFAAVAIGDSNEKIGIDIEDSTRPQLAKVANRFLSALELEVLSVQPDGLAKAWTAKEAVYKAGDTPGVDFSRDIELSLPALEKAFLRPRGSTYSLSFYSVEPHHLFCLATECNN